MSALLWLIPLAIYVWFAYLGDRKQKETATAYFWMFVLAVGVLGTLYTFFQTGSVPAGCCGD